MNGLVIKFGDQLVTLFFVVKLILESLILIACETLQKASQEKQEFDM